MGNDDSNEIEFGECEDELPACAAVLDAVVSALGHSAGLNNSGRIHRVESVEISGFCA